MVDKIALLLTVLGSINWGLVGAFQFDAVAWIFGGGNTVGARVVYVLVAVAALWCISLFFRDTEIIHTET